MKYYLKDIPNLSTQEKNTLLLTYNKIIQYILEKGDNDKKIVIELLEIDNPKESASLIRIDKIIKQTSKTIEKIRITNFCQEAKQYLIEQYAKGNIQYKKHIVPILNAENLSTIEKIENPNEQIELIKKIIRDINEVNLRILRKVNATITKTKKADEYNAEFWCNHVTTLIDELRDDLGVPDEILKLLEEIHKEELNKNLDSLVIVSREVQEKL